MLKPWLKTGEVGWLVGAASIAPEKNAGECPWLETPMLDREFVFSEGESLRIVGREWPGRGGGHFSMCRDSARVFVCMDLPPCPRFVRERVFEPRRG
jgi:hypothetical protein